MTDNLPLLVVLSVIIGTLAAIVYSLRVLVLMERRVARIERHIEALVNQVLQREAKIETMLERTSSSGTRQATSRATRGKRRR